jgi:peptidoglycan/LPS O-acetylase OafA/YrhL
MHDGRQAVQVFYVISGFYMAMVLSTRYSAARAFYASRFLRIFPPYGIALAATLLASAAGGLLFGQWLMLAPWAAHPLARNGGAGLALVALSNLTLFGQDWVMFLSHEAGARLRFTANFWDDSHPLWHYLLVPQAWTVGLELTFYALAPFLNRLRGRWLALLALATFAARALVAWRAGLSHDPWNYRFFPFELGLFLFGMLGYRLYARVGAPRASSRWRCRSLPSYLAGSAILLALLWAHLRLVALSQRLLGPEAGVIATYPLWIVGVPLLFFAFGAQRHDRVLGELSYPIYLLHFLVLTLVALAFRHLGLPCGVTAASALACLLLAAAMYRAVVVPLDRRRHVFASAPVEPLPPAARAGSA